MKALLRWLGLVLLAGIALQLFFVGRIALMAVVDPQSTTFQRSEAWRIAHEKHRLPWSQRWVPYASISDNLKRAVIASEDQRFCLDHGVDFGAIRDVVEDEDSPSRGASTIAMQTVKNVFLWPGRSYIRKAIEIPLALALDTLWGKRRMMEIYLNVAEWGDGIYGAQAASRHWFGKDASRLTRNEAALLAAVLPNPITRSAGRPSPGVRRRAARIQAMMGQIDGLTGCLRR